MRTTFRLRSAIIATVAGVMAATAPPALPLPGHAAVDLLNKQRAANGIPGDLVEDPQMSDGCRKHETQYKESSTQNPHDEVDGQPGYTPEGRDAARRSDLSGGAEWSDTTNPWSGYALHLSLLFEPGVTTAWYGDGRYGACMGTGDWTREFPGPAFFSLPGDGSAGVEIKELAGGEAPFSVQEAAGLGDRASGPVTVLFPEGVDDPQIADAAMTRADGAAVAVKWVDGDTPAPKSNNPNLPWGSTVGRTAGYVIPVKPLAPATVYTTVVTWRDSAGATYTQKVAYHTGPKGGGGQTIYENSALGINDLGMEFREHRLVIRLQRGMPGQPITATAARNGAAAKTLVIPTDPSRYLASSDPVFEPGRYRVCISVPEGTYHAYSACSPVIYRGEMTNLVSIGRPCHGMSILHVKPLAAGIRATVEWIGGPSRGGFLTTDVKTRLRLQAGTTVLHGPPTTRHGHTYLVVTLPTSKLGGATYLGTDRQLSSSGRCRSR